MSQPDFYCSQVPVCHWIGGRRFNLAGARMQDVFNPALGEVARQVALGGQAEVERAVASARAAFPAWADLPPVRRARCLSRLVQLLDRHRDDLAAMVTSEHGKTLADAHGEVAR